MKNKLKVFFIGLLVLCMTSVPALSQSAAPLVIEPPKIESDSSKNQEMKNSVVSIAIDGIRYILKADNDNELVGNGVKIGLGGGYIAKSWYMNGMLDILLGPYEPTRDKQLNVDYVGTGLSYWWGTSAQTLDLRSSEGSYGFAVGLNYADVVGRSVGRNRKETTNPADPENSNLIDNYIMRVTSFSVTPALFFAWLKGARPKGNTPDLLATRLEGYVMTVGVAIPLLASYQAHYDKRGDVTEQFEPKKISEKGPLKGYSLLVSLNAFLGF